jgi:hypothetical protein
MLMLVPNQGAMPIRIKARFLCGKPCKNQTCLAAQRHNLTLTLENSRELRMCLNKPSKSKPKSKPDLARSKQKSKQKSNNHNLSLKIERLQENFWKK